MKIKKTLLIDFDGVIHFYNSHHGDAYDPCVINGGVVPGVIEFIKSVKDKYKIVVFSTRASTVSGYMAISEFLKNHGIEVDFITDRKLPAYVTIDDRCIQFNGDFTGLKDKIDSFMPWWREAEVTETPVELPEPPEQHQYQKIVPEGAVMAEEYCKTASKIYASALGD